MSEITTPTTSRCKKSCYSETSSISQRDLKDSSKNPVIISQVSGILESINNELHDDCLMTVLELNDGQPKLDITTETYANNTGNEKPKKFRINLIKPKKDLETRKSQLLEEKEMFELRLKRFPGYIISNVNCITQGDFELPQNCTENDTNNQRVRKTSINSYSTTKLKQKLDKTSKKSKYSTPEDAIKFYDSITDIKIKNEDDFDKEMLKRFPLGDFIFKDKIHVYIIYIPECEILRKWFIGYYGLNLIKFNNEDFEDWCQKNFMFNSKSMYESYFNTNSKPRECNLLLKGMMTKYHVGIILSDFFRNGNFAAYRALVVFGEILNNIKLCIEEIKVKLPVNISPYIHYNPNDECSLAPNDFEEIDYFRRNYHRLMFSDDVFF